jgi:hypothetical protein
MRVEYRSQKQFNIALNPDDMVEVADNFAILVSAAIALLKGSQSSVLESHST